MSELQNIHVNYKKNIALIFQFHQKILTTFFTAHIFLMHFK